MQGVTRRAAAGRWAAEPDPVELCGFDRRPGWRIAEHVLFYGTFGWATAQAVPPAMASSGGAAALAALAGVLVGWYACGAVLRSRLVSMRGRTLRVGVTCALWVAVVVVYPSYTLVGLGVLAHVYDLLPWRMALPAAVVVVGVMSSRSALAGDGLQVGEIASAILVIGLLVLGSISMRATVVESVRRQRLIEELRETRDELAAAERRAGMADERQRLAAELHDTLTQGFTSIVMLLEAAQASLRDAGSDRAKPVRDVETALGIARESLGEVRSLVWALRPEALEQQTLPEALERLTSRLEDEAGLTARTVVTGDVTRLPFDVETTLLRAGQEALANVRRHARASEVTVTLSYMPDMVALDVRDDGAGFEAGGPPGATSQGGGLGLIAMRERAAALGGDAAVESAPGEGTCVTVRLPAAPEHDPTVPAGEVVVS